MASAMRYSYELVVEEIQRFLNRSERGTQKRLAAAAGLDQSGFRHRMQEREGMRFTYEQLGAISVEAQAPLGWPFLTWQTAESVQAVLRLVENVRPPG